MDDGARGSVLGVLLTVGAAPIDAATMGAAQQALSDLLVVRLDDADSDELRASVRGGGSVVLIDSRCAGVTAEILTAAADEDERPVVYVQPVLETLKLVRDGRVAGTVDRDQVRVVATPIVAPGALLDQVADLAAALRDPVVLVRALRALGPVDLREAPPHVRRMVPGQTSLG